MFSNLATAKLKVAIIGGGGAGVTTAWLLDNDAEITLYEKEEHLGGHANTINITLNGKTIPMYIHGDSSFMPNDFDKWSVANVAFDGRHSTMAMHKKWLSSTPVFKSWILDSSKKLPRPLYAQVKYRHPIIDAKYMRAQHAIQSIQGRDNLWFAGVYTFDINNHESTIISAMRVARGIAPNSERLKRMGHRF